MEVIDFHTHIYPERIARKATQSICEFYELNSGLDGTSQALIAEGRKAGISKFVLLPVAIKPEHVRHINQFTAGEAEAHDMFFGFGTLHAGMADPLSEIGRIEALGLKGIKLHPDTQQFPIDDRRLFPVYDALQDRLPVMIHCGDPRYHYSHPERLKRILKQFPKLKVIAAHLGGWSMFDEAFAYLKDETCYFDLSSCMMFLGSEQMKKYISGYGAGRILFGSDFPLWSPRKELEAFRKLDLSRDEQEAILCRNARCILNITG